MAEKVKTKAALIAGSQNAQGSILAIVSFALNAIFSGANAAGAEIAVTGEQVVSTVQSGDIKEILSVALYSAILPLLKFIQNGGLTWANISHSWKESTNFKKDLAILLTTVLACFGIAFSPETIEQVFGLLGSDAGLTISGLFAAFQAIVSGRKIAAAQA